MKMVPQAWNKSMSVVGQKRRFERRPVTSGLPSTPTFSAPVGMSQRCHRPARQCAAVP